MIEYRIGWAASSNATFRDTNDWEPWDDEAATAAEVEEALYRGQTSMPDGLEIALEASGFEWWVETRESA